MPPHAIVKPGLGLLLLASACSGPIALRSPTLTSGKSIETMDAQASQSPTDVPQLPAEATGTQKDLDASQRPVKQNVWSPGAMFWTGVVLGVIGLPLAVAVPITTDFEAAPAALGGAMLLSAAVLLPLSVMLERRDVSRVAIADPR